MHNLLLFSHILTHDSNWWIAHDLATLSTDKNDGFFKWDDNLNCNRILPFDILPDRKLRGQRIRFSGQAIQLLESRSNTTNITTVSQFSIKPILYVIMRQYWSKTVLLLTIAFTTSRWWLRCVMIRAPLEFPFLINFILIIIMLGHPPFQFWSSFMALPAMSGQSCMLWVVLRLGLLCLFPFWSKI